MNVLITADIHYGEYNDYNHTPNARLEQFNKLSDRYIELAKENNCEELWIAGDFLKVPNNNPKILHGLKEFLIPLSRYFKKVRYILGNHDINNKSDYIKETDTIITIFDFDNFEYCDKKVFEFGNTKIAFMNWYPSQNLDWIETKVDILIGHYTKSALFGQAIDDSKFDLCIHGDIHNDQHIDKFVSINIPFQHDMNCIQDGSCIVLNCETKEWKRIKTDPDRSRFLRIQYVTEQILEGFETPLKYNIYRPVISKNKEGVAIDIPKWKDISELIELIINKSNLQNIHEEIKSKCIQYSEIDFNFQLKFLKVHGFRSIIDFELSFNGNDRIILLGKNGSGKSSIIKSIKAEFEKCRYMKDERSEFTDSVSVTIGLFYQNKLFEITKGDGYELKIDGVLQTYNNQTQFENDLFEKLPFFGYSDLFFITSDIQNLSSKFTPDRRIELISKFYRLDRIDAYSKTSYQLSQELLEKLIPIKNDLIRAKGALETIQTRLTELKEVSEIDIEELKSKLLGYNKLREDDNQYKLWTSNHEKLLIRKSDLERTLETYKTKLNPEHGIEYIRERVTEVEDQIKKIEEFELEFNKRWRKLTEISTQKTQLYNEGVKLNSQLESLKKGVCSTCGSKLSEGDAAKNISDLEEKIKKIKESYSPIYKEFTSYTEDERSANYFETQSKVLREKLKDKKDELNIFSTKKTQYDIAKEHFDIESKNLKKIEDDIEIHLKDKPSEVQLPINLSELEFEVTSKITNYSSYLNELDKEKSKLEEINSLELKIREYQDKSDIYLTYTQLTSRTGNIYEEILRKLAEVFSESDFKYEVQVWESRGKKNTAFNSYYKVKNKYRIYERLSDGQKTVCDLDFLNKLFSVRVGLLIMDEHLRHLDEDNLPKASDILSKMNVNSIVISTHDTNYSQYTKKVLLELNSEGHTISKTF